MNLMHGAQKEIHRSVYCLTAATTFLFSWKEQNDFPVFPDLRGEPSGLDPQTLA
jgi:hypothetical protein